MAGINLRRIFRIVVLLGCIFSLVACSHEREQASIESALTARDVYVKSWEADRKLKTFSLIITLKITFASGETSVAELKGGVDRNVGRYWVGGGYVSGPVAELSEMQHLEQFVDARSRRGYEKSSVGDWRPTDNSFLTDGGLSFIRPEPNSAPPENLEIVGSVTINGSAALHLKSSRGDRSWTELFVNRNDFRTMRSIQTVVVDSPVGENNKSIRVRFLWLQPARGVSERPA